MFICLAIIQKPSNPAKALASPEVPPPMRLPQHRRQSSSTPGVRIPHVF